MEAQQLAVAQAAVQHAVDVDVVGLGERGEEVKGQKTDGDLLQSIHLSQGLVEDRR